MAGRKFQRISWKDAFYKGQSIYWREAFYKGSETKPGPIQRQETEKLTEKACEGKRQRGRVQPEEREANIEREGQSEEPMLGNVAQPRANSASQLFVTHTHIS